MCVPPRLCRRGFVTFTPVPTYDMKKERRRIARSFIPASKMPQTPTPFPFLQQTAIADLTRSKFLATSALRFEKKNKKQKRDRGEVPVTWTTGCSGR